MQWKKYEKPKNRKKKNRTFWQDIVMWMQTQYSVQFRRGNSVTWPLNPHNSEHFIFDSVPNICSSQCLICKSVIYAQVISDGHNSFQTALNMIRNHCTWKKHYNKDTLYQYDVNSTSGFAVATTLRKSSVAACRAKWNSVTSARPAAMYWTQYWMKLCRESVQHVDMHGVLEAAGDETQAALGRNGKSASTWYRASVRFRPDRWFGSLRDNTEPVSLYGIERQQLSWRQ